MNITFEFYAQNLDSIHYGPVNVPCEDLIDGITLPYFKCNYDTSVEFYCKTKLIIKDSFPAEYIFTDGEKNILHLKNCTFDCRCSDCQHSLNLFIEISDSITTKTIYFNESNAYLVYWNSWIMPRFNFMFEGELMVVENKYYIKINQYFDFDSLRKMPQTSSFVIQR